MSTSTVNSCGLVFRVKLKYVNHTSTFFCVCDSEPGQPTAMAKVMEYLEGNAKNFLESDVELLGKGVVLE